MRQGFHRARENHVNFAGVERGHGRRCAAIGHVGQVQIGSQREKCPGKMVGRPNPAAAIGQPPRRGARGRQYILHALIRRCRTHHHGGWNIRNQAHGGQGYARIKPAIGVKRRHAGKRCAGQHKGRAIGRRLHHGMDTDAAARSWAVFDDEGLTQPFLEMLREQAPHQINRPARAKGNDDTHRPIRPGRLRDSAGDEGQGERGTEQHPARGILHGGSSSARIKG